MDQEKRAAPRFLFSEQVSYGFPETSFQGSVGGNISLTGVSLKVQEFVAVGSVLDLQLPLGSSSRVVWVKAEVVRVREVLSEDCYEIGLKFAQNHISARVIGGYLDSRRYEST